MDTTLTSLAQIVLAVIAIGIGTVKVIRPYESLREQFFWLEDLTPEMVRGIGFTEMLIGVSLVLPTALGLSYWVAAAAAAAYAALMLVIAALHSSTSRGPLVVVPRAALVALSLVVIVGVV